MIAAICLLLPPLISILISQKLTQRKESQLYIVVRYVVYAVILNGVIWIILRLFFTHGDRPIYNLNHNRIFAFKYIALAIALAIFIALIEPILRNLYKSLYARFEPVLIYLKELICHYSMQLRVISFIVILGGIFGVANFIVQPFWNINSNNDFDTICGFYKEPPDSIETLFLGPSLTRYAISPMELYEKYGICAYDISTNSQPILSSYYWLEEVYRLHKNTLNTVVLDVDMVKKNPGTSNYHLAFDYMHLSNVKLHAIKAYSKNFTDFLFNVIPLYNYHDRWKELTDDDFHKYRYKPESYKRGYEFTTNQWLNNVLEFSDISIPLLICDKNADETTFNKTAYNYLEMIVSFCKDHNIQLILIKTPTYWTSNDHNAVQTFAAVNGIKFVDFNIDPIYSGIKFNLATDVITPTDIKILHLNYYGAMKMTDYLGDYLISVCDNHDIRENPQYAFMNGELENYHRYIASADLQKYTDPCDYISYALDQGDYTIFISVKDEASDALTDEQREYFASIGLDKLAEITSRASYLTVIEDGVIKTELYSEDPGEKNKTDKLLEYSGMLPDGTEYTISSGGYYHGNKSSIKIDDTERSNNNRGLNIVIYDNKREQYVDRANFDTHSVPERPIQNVELRLANELDEGAVLSELSGTERILYLYNRRCKNEKNVALTRQEVGDNDLIGYIDAFINDDDLDIYISIKNDDDKVINYNVRTELDKRGLTVLSSMPYQDPYIALISGGEVVFEVRAHGEDGVEAKTDKYYMSSGNDNEGGVSSIKIDGTEYSPNENGINIVVYDNITEMVIDKITFDIGNITPALPEGAAA